VPLRAKSAHVHAFSRCEARPPTPGCRLHYALGGYVLRLTKRVPWRVHQGIAGIIQAAEFMRRALELPSMRTLNGDVSQ